MLTNSRMRRTAPKNLFILHFECFNLDTFASAKWSHTARSVSPPFTSTFVSFSLATMSGKYARYSGLVVGVWLAYIHAKDCLCTWYQLSLLSGPQSTFAVTTINTQKPCTPTSRKLPCTDLQAAWLGSGKRIMFSLYSHKRALSDATLSGPRSPPIRIDGQSRHRAGCHNGSSASNAKCARPDTVVCFRTWGTNQTHHAGSTMI